MTFNEITIMCMEYGRLIIWYFYCPNMKMKNYITEKQFSDVLNSSNEPGFGMDITFFKGLYQPPNFYFQFTWDL